MIDISIPEVKFALDVTQQAGLLVREIQREMAGESIAKEDHSPVTAADFAAQAFVAQRLKTEFPADPLVGEEEASRIEPELLARIAGFVRRYEPSASPEFVAQWINYGKGLSARRFWTLDPIDGTKGFLRGEQYAVALALIEDGHVVLGALASPNLENASSQVMGGRGSLVIARRDQGSWSTSLENPGEFTRLSVSTISNPKEARLLRSFEAGHTNVSQLDMVANELGTDAEPLRLDSQAKYAMLASGAAELLFRLISPKMPDYKEKIWDQAAGLIVCEEAGGMVTDLDGKPLDFTHGRTLAANRGVLASNTHLHEAALSALRSQSA